MKNTRCHIVERYKNDIENFSDFSMQLLHKRPCVYVYHTLRKEVIKHFVFAFLPLLKNKLKP